MAHSKINNSIYSDLGERWYTAYDDPVALLRSQSLAILPWITGHLNRVLKGGSQILDVGCGGGFISNALALQNYGVTGIDASQSSLEIAKKYDSTKSVNYCLGHAHELPFRDSLFDAVTAIDFLEHVENPETIIKEVSRVLKPGGVFLFHTFNRNIISTLVVIKFMELFIKNTPKNLHVSDLFITPKEITRYCESSQLRIFDFRGLRPCFSTLTFRDLLKGTVPRDFRFKITNSVLISYLGAAIKNS